MSEANEVTPTASVGWWSVDDNMPKEFEHEWVWWRHPGSTEARRIGIGYWTGCYLGWRLYDGDTIADVSHWHHLEKPKRPKLGENVIINPKRKEEA